MKVVNILEESKWGGPQKRALLVAESLKLNYAVETTFIINSRDSTFFENKILSIPFKVKKLNITRPSKSTLSLYLFTFVLDLLRIFHEIIRLNPDLIHISGGCFSCKSFLAAILTMNPVIWHVNDTMTPAWARYAFKILSSFSTGFICASFASREYYNLEKHKNVWIIPAPAQNTLISQNISSNKKFNVYSVFNPNPIKDLELFLQIVKLTDSHQVSNICFHHYGYVFNSQNVYLQKCLERTSTSHKRFSAITHGFISDVNLINHCNSIYLCTSQAESSPLTVWEALSKGVPVISTDVGDVPLIIQKYNCGIIHKRTSREELAQLIFRSILNYMQNPSLYHLHSKNAIIAYKSEFTLELVTKKTNQAYRSCN